MNFSNEMNTSQLSTTEVKIEERKVEDLIEVPPANLPKLENCEESSKIRDKCSKWIRIYLKKFSGLHEERPKRLSWPEYFWSFLGAFLGIAAVAFLHFRLLDP